VDELCRAAEATGTRFVPFPAFNYKDAYNFYLPIYFKYGVRIEVEALDEIDEFYTQIDYRLDPGEEHVTRLVSELTNAGLVLKYNGDATISSGARKLAKIKLSHASTDLRCGPQAGNCQFTIEGPGILRRLSILGDPPPDLQLEVYWDGDVHPSIRSPIKYFFADFVNGAMESRPNERTCYFPMPFRHKARIVLYSPSSSPTHITVDYAVERGTISSKIPYFHAAYHDTQKTLGYSQYPILQIHGKGIFVGLNLFDSGHNHGGGDAALIDAGTDHPRVLHGICGEDYFAFAWHHTGTMTPLTGAPVQERRYRLHLENPYPFSESFQFLFGVFANLQPKSVAFWYQVPEPLRLGKWVSFDTPWKVFGPIGLETPLPGTVNDQIYETTVAINNPTKLTVRWQDVKMISGFLDLTYQFRHYVLVEKGSGFVAGASRTELTTHIYSPSKRNVDAILGHDDGVLVRLNGATISNLTGRSGFGPSPLCIPLRSGWNTFDLTLSNDENVNWRWSGLSLAFRRAQNQTRGLRFSPEIPFNSDALGTSLEP
jgi:hypothetical protein